MLGPLVQTEEGGGFPSRTVSGACPSSAGLEDITVDVLQLLSSRYGLRPLGLSRSYPAESCDQIGRASPGSLSGMYWVGDAESSVQMYCQF